MQTMLSASTFVLAALAMVAVALGFVAPRLLRPFVPGASASAGAVHLDAARARARELDRALAAGEWTPETHAQARIDLERELMHESPAPPLPARAASRAFGWGVCAAVPLVATALYLVLGEPAALRPDFTAPPDFQTLSPTALAAYVQQHPQDARGWVLLARTQAQGDQFADAAASYARALTFAKVARDARVWSEYADAVGMMQGGRLAGRPERLIEEALKRDPAHPQALELAGSAAYEQGDFARAATQWRRLLERLPPGAAERSVVAAAIARAEREAATRLPINTARSAVTQ